MYAIRSYYDPPRLWRQSLLPRRDRHLRWGKGRPGCARRHPRDHRRRRSSATCSSTIDLISARVSGLKRTRSSTRLRNSGRNSRRSSASTAVRALSLISPSAVTPSRRKGEPMFVITSYSIHYTKLYDSIISNCNWSLSSPEGFFKFFFFFLKKLRNANRSK